jgi:HSP20 family protein
MAGRSLTPWGGGRELDRFRREMDTLFDRFTREPFGFFTPAAGPTTLSPDLDVSETESNVLIRCELPGVDPKDVDINISGDVLTIRGEKKLTEEEQKESFDLVERNWGAFSRSIALPQHVKPEKVEAHYKNGVLKIVLPKAEEAKARKIEIKTT